MSFDIVVCDAVAVVAIPFHEHNHDRQDLLTNRILLNNTWNIGVWGGVAGSVARNNSN